MTNKNNMFADVDTIEGVVSQAVGGGSVCWENLADTGVFDSDQAKKISENALERIEEIRNAEPKSWDMGAARITEFVPQPPETIDVRVIHYLLGERVFHCGMPGVPAVGDSISVGDPEVPTGNVFHVRWCFDPGIEIAGNVTGSWHLEVAVR